MTNSNTEQPEQTSHDVSAAQAPTDQPIQSETSSQGEQVEASGKPRGRKLRTPFRRRRSDAATGEAVAEEGAPERKSRTKVFEPNVVEEVIDPRDVVDIGDPVEFEKEGDQALSYLSGTERIEQRLNKYLNSDLLMPSISRREPTPASASTLCSLGIKRSLFKYLFKRCSIRSVPLRYESA